MKILGTDWEDDLIRRAMSAWFRSGGTEQPSNTSDMIEHDGKLYVRLMNVRRILAVYRVRIVNGAPVLKGLKRWPSEVA